MSRVKGVAKRLGGFTASVVVSGVVSLATVPFVVVYAGTESWAAVAVGQSLGAIVGIFTLLGWVQNGPTEVARSSPADRGSYFARSVYVRCLSLVVTVPVVAVVSVLLGTAHVGLCVLSALTILVMNLGASWFFVGEGNPFGLFVFETIPKAAGIAAGTVALALGAAPVVYGWLGLAGAVCAVAVSWLDVFRRNPRHGYVRPSVRGVVRIVKEQKHGIGTAVLSAVYLSAPLLIVQGLYAGATATFALADKIKQQAMTAYRPASQVAQGWTPKAGRTEMHRRVQAVAKWILPLAFAAALSFSAFGPLASHLLSGGRIQIGWGMAVAFGIAFGMNIISLTVGVACLVPLGRESSITGSATIGLVTFAASAVPAGLLLGGVGIAWAVALGQSAVAAYQLVVFTTHMRRLKRERSNEVSFAERGVSVGHGD